MEAGGRAVKRQRVDNASKAMREVEPEIPNTSREASTENPLLSLCLPQNPRPTSPQHPPQATANDAPSAHTDAVIKFDSIPHNPDVGSVSAPLSKSKLKKLRRDQAWEAGREYRKAQRKEKLQAKRERLRATRAVDSTGASADPAAAISAPPTDGIEPSLSTRGHPLKREYKKAVQLPVTLLLDCGFDDLMSTKEIISLGSQVTRAYSDNAKASFRAHLVVSSFGGNLKQRFDTILARQHEGWKFVGFTEDNFGDAAERAAQWMRGARGGQVSGALESVGHEEEGETVYLTSDSPDTITTLKPYSTYIIGGLVDKNRHKGICYKRAMDAGVKTAKLPIGEYMQMNSRSVLATNHVVEIMLRWLECGDWGEAFAKVIPKRKGGVLREREEQRSYDTSGIGAEEPREDDVSTRDCENEDREDDSSGAAAHVGENGNAQGTLEV